MKKLIFICGANGIGKSTACRELNMKLNNSALVDSDFCRLIYPFEFSEDIKATITKNMSALLINYFSCSAVDNVIFLYGFHGPRKKMFEDVMKYINANNVKYEFVPIILECELEENIRRAERDNRSLERIKYGIEATREIYKQYNYPKIDVTNLSVEETVNALLKVISHTK